MSRDLRNMEPNLSTKLTRRPPSPNVGTTQVETNVRTGMQAADLRQAVMDHLRYSVGILEAFAKPHDYYRALALAIRERMQHRWISTSQTYFDVKRKVACYLSAEYLMGPHLGNNLVNLNLEQPARAALAELGQDLDAVLACGNLGSGL